MSFLSVLGKIGSTALSIEHVAAPIISTFVPGAAPVLAIVDSFVPRVQASIQTVEAANPASGLGAAKSAAVVADFEAGLALFQGVLAGRGEQLVFDRAALEAAIAGQVAAYNGFATVKASFKIVPSAPVSASSPAGVV